jgi:hypothetical protein
LEANIDRKKQLGIVAKIDHIEITNVEMKKEHLDALVAILISGRATNSCTDVYFDNVNLCGEGIISLSKLVDASLELRRFSLHHNRINSTESARCLSRSLKSHTRITRLHLTHCNLGCSPEVLLVILQSVNSHINLSNNDINSLGAIKIAEYLAGNPPIKYLSLKSNRLNDDDAILISQALKMNRNLIHLHLEGNNLTSVGVRVLLTSFYDGSSLNAISQSNHTLQRLWLFWKSKNLAGCIYRLLIELGRTEKILLALQDKDSILQYLANVPVELIPEVLAFPRRVFDQPHHNHLNIVYSTLRWWNMSMLYSYNCCVKSDTKRKRGV